MSTTFAIASDLVFDLGMNDGTDTAAYLAQGYRVVAVEPNIDLCERAHARFRREIEADRCIVVYAAVGAEEGFSSFWLNLEDDHLSSTSQRWAARNGARVRQSVVSLTTIEALIRGYGSPLYIKCDIEGLDGAAISAMQRMYRGHARPLFISVEDCRNGPDTIDRLCAQGYDLFALSEQSRHGRGFSGPFGDALDCVWRSELEFRFVYHMSVRDIEGRRIAPEQYWFDIHATNAAAFAQYRARRAA